MTRTSLARRRPAVGPVLQQTALDTLGGARAALADRSLDDTTVVHEIRKAMKRWRAFLRLVAFALGDESKRLRAEARDLARTLRRSRDAQSALDALDDVLKHQPEGALPASAAATMRQRLIAIRVESEAGQLGTGDRARLAETLAATADSIADWPLAKAQFGDLADALTKIYRRGWRLVPKDWKAADAEHLHELRQRTVELRHQIEFLAPLLPGLPRRAVSEPQRLRNQLGRHQDLTLLWPLMAPRQPLARWRSRLAPLIQARQADHLAAAERSAEQVFDCPPKAFRKRLITRWSTGSDPAQ